MKHLEKGLNFFVVPQKIPVEDLICFVEKLVQNMPVNVAEEVNQECKMVLKRAKLRKSNISENDELFLKILRNDKHIVVIKGDLGNATVMMDKEYYDKEML